MQPSQSAARRAASLAVLLLTTSAAATALPAAASAASVSAVPAIKGGLVGVAATSARSAWAVGFRGSPTGTDQEKVLALRWTGTAWRQAAVPALPRTSALAAVAATSAGNAWAVGVYDASLAGRSRARP